MQDFELTSFEFSDELSATLAECMDNHDVGESEAEWPNNMISRRAVVYESGLIARREDKVIHRVDSTELALCKRLANEAASLMAGVDVGMGSESGDPFRPFFIVANKHEVSSQSIDEALIRAKFGGTLFPPATITIEPLAESGAWWSEVLYDCSEMEEDDQEEYLRPWRVLIAWFQEQTEFVDTTFISIGDNDALWQLPESQWPAGTEVTPCVLPRLVLGLTPKGSLTGLFGFSVQT